MKSIIYLDLDGVLVDFKGTLDEMIPTWEQEIKKPEWGLMGDYPSLYAMLEPMPDALMLYEACCHLVGDKNRVHVLTALPGKSRHKFPDCAKDKIEWVAKYISKDLRVHFGPSAKDKQYHCKHPQDVLIDDMVRNTDQWNVAGGIGILHVDSITSLIELTIKYNELE